MIDFVDLESSKLEKHELDRIKMEIFINYSLFDRFTVRQDYIGTSHGHTKTIPLRLGKSITPDTETGDLTVHSMINEMEFSDWDNRAKFPTVNNVVANIMKNLGLKELGWLTIVSLRPDCRVSRHIDEGEYCANFHRFHICIFCDPSAQNIITVNDQDYEMHEGKVISFNNKSLHSAKNISAKHERIHIIFDAR